MGFIFGVLILGALLALVFGKKVGQLFVLGTWGVISVIIGVFVLILIAGLIQMQFLPKETYTHTSMGSPYINTYSPPSSAAPTTYSAAPTTYSVAPTTYSAAPTTYSDGVPLIHGANPGMPIIGVTLDRLSLKDEVRLALPQGGGEYVEAVTPGSPAERGGIAAGDVLTSQGNEAISMWNQVPDYLARRRVGVPVSYYRYRMVNGQMYQGYVSVTPR